MTTALEQLAVEFQNISKKFEAYDAIESKLKENTEEDPWRTEVKADLAFLSKRLDHIEANVKDDLRRISAAMNNFADNMRRVGSPPSTPSCGHW